MKNLLLFPVVAVLAIGATALAPAMSQVPTPHVAEAPGALAPTVTLQRLDELANELLSAGGHSFEGTIVGDAVQSGGAAAIRYQGSQSVVFVNPQLLSSWSLNTWAFVIGHEFGHQVTRLGGTPHGESSADVVGGRLAVGAGYDAAGYVRHLLGMANSCSPTHGCWHSRARTLAQALGVAVEFPDGHTGHRPAAGLPGQRVTDVLPPLPVPRPIPVPVPQPVARRVPCTHALHAFDTVHPFDWYGNQRGPCQHRTPCGHAAHPFDIVH